MLCSSQVGDWKTTVDDDLSAPKLQKPVHWEATEMGGACSCAGIGVILALVSVIIIQFNSSMNAVNKAYMQPARVATISEYSELPVYALASGPALMPALTEGLVVQVAVMGPLCGSVTAETSGNYDGEFEAAVATVDAKSSLFVHTLTCAECVFGPLWS